jgi:hypothetical protein
MNAMFVLNKTLRAGISAEYAESNLLQTTCVQETLWLFFAYFIPYVLATKKLHIKGMIGA